MDTSNFTATSDLFILNNPIKMWRFEVAYSFADQSSGSSAIHFEINQPPSGGSCAIEPNNGTTTTLFNVSCMNWSDQHGIKAYFLYSENLCQQPEYHAARFVFCFSLQYGRQALLKER
jgi:hypothetical protein